MVEQLYVAPDWIGRGVGGRLLALAKERRRPASTCTASGQRVRAPVLRAARVLRDRVRRRQRATRSGQPDVRYAWRPTARPSPDRRRRAPDGTPIAVFSSGSGPPLVLVHGAAADHTTFRVVGPLLGAALHASTPSTGAGAARRATRSPYAIEREFEDVAAVADGAGRRGRRRRRRRRALVRRPLRARRRAPDRRRSAGSSPTRAPRRRRATLRRRRPARRARAGSPTPAIRDERARRAFMARVVGMTPADLEPTAPTRSGRAASPPRATIVRELESEARPGGGPRRARRGRASPSCRSWAATACRDSARRPAPSTRGSPTGAIVIIAGARHAAHHTHPEAFVEAVTAFLPSLTGRPWDTRRMPELGFFGWIVVGLSRGRSPARSSAGAPPAAACRTSSSASWAASSVAGLRQQMGFTQVSGLIAAIVVAALGSIVVRLILNALDERDRSPTRCVVGYHRP